MSKLTDEQRLELEALWFIYGNDGPRSTMSGHKFIQCLLEQGEDHREFFKPSQKVIEKVDEILQEKGHSS